MRRRSANAPPAMKKRPANTLMIRAAMSVIANIISSRLQGDEEEEEESGRESSKLEGIRRLNQINLEAASFRLGCYLLLAC